MLIACTALAGCAGVPKHGQIAVDRSLMDVDGTPRQIAAGHTGPIALIFITHDCPIANGYAPEINSIVQEYEPRGVRFFLVHVDRELSCEVARQHAREFGYRCTVLMDPHHELVNEVKASVTPEAAVISSDRRVAYRGRIDDRYTDFGKKRVEPSQRDLREALDAVLAGRDVPHPRTRAIGCYITSDIAAQLDAESVN